MQVEHCYRHADRETGRHCTRCGKPACWECLVQASVGSHCLECVSEARASGPRRVIAPSRAGVGTATKVLIGINVIIFLLTQARPRNEVLSDFGLWGPAVADGEPWLVVTSGFLHAGFLHLAMNMWALWNLGVVSEMELGTRRYLTVYGLSLLGGAAGALVVDALQHDPRLTVGASGAIFGLLGSRAVALHFRGISLAQSGIGFILLINVLLTLGVPGISIGGHLGGFLVGAAVQAVMIPRRTPVVNERLGVLLVLLAVCGVIAIAAPMI